MFFIYRTFLHYAAENNLPILFIKYFHKRLERSAEKWQWQDDLHNAVYGSVPDFAAALAKYDVPDPFEPEESSDQDQEDDTEHVEAEKPDKIDLAHAMIDASIDVNVRALQGETPLHLAAAVGSTRCVSIIMALYGKVHLADNNGLTPLHYAIREDKPAVATKLMEYEECDVNAKDVNCNTPLHYAAMSNSVGCIKLLQEHKADLNTKNMQGRTPLHFAAEQGHTDAVDCLLQLGADPNIRDVNGWAPLRLAIKGDFQDVISLLLQYGTRPY